MNWIIMLVLSFVVPVVQPAMQQSVQNVQARFQQRLAALPAQQDQPKYVFHEGRWWKYEGGQWYVWNQNPNPNSERIAHVEQQYR